MSTATDLLRRLFFYQSARHAEMWRNKAGRTGYSPACRERFSAACKARKADLGSYQCNSCPHRVLAPLTEERLEAHLRGRITLGAYQLSDDAERAAQSPSESPLSPSAFAGWLCIDVDADEDTDHARANVKRLTQLLAARTRRLGLPCYVEYTGNKGFHIWVFCPDGAPATDLRRLGRWIVASVLDEEGEFAGIHAEVFPKQVALDDRDPFGNLVKAPLGRHRKTNQRCLFIDDDYKPYPDQVAFLLEVQTVTAEEIAQALEDWVPDEAGPDAGSNGHGTTPVNASRSPSATRYNLADNIAQAARNLERLADHRRDDYDAWLEVGMALSELGDVGLAMWDSWSRQSPKYEEGACAAKWATIEPAAQSPAAQSPAAQSPAAGAPGHGLTVASLVHWAREDSGGAAVSRPVQAEPYHRTDMGNAQRLVDLYGQDLHYSYLERRWYIWSGIRWAADLTGEVYRYGKETVRNIYQEAADCDNDDLRKALSKWAHQSETESRINAMVSLAESEPGMPVVHGDLDADPWVLNVLNGTVDLRTGALRPHRREDLITKLAPVVYDPDARSETWERFLAYATRDDASLQTFLARAVGYSLVGAPSEEKLFLVHGPGAAGKSTFIEAIKRVLGDYAATADFETFLKRSQVTGAPRNDIARLAGARFVASIEVDEGKKLAEGLVKQISGGDTVTARFMYKEAFEFVPQFTLWLCANHAPEVKDDDDAMWRRILRVPFERVVPEDERDPELKKELGDPARSGSAILAWAVQGCLDWLQHGLNVPDLVIRATARYRKTQDPLGDFISECCVLGPTAHVPSGDLRRAYEDWARDNGLRPITGKDFAARLKAFGCKPSQVIRFQDRTKRCWVGIGLQGGEADRLFPLGDDPSTDDTPDEGLYGGEPTPF